VLNFSSSGPTERARAVELVLAGISGTVKACKRALSVMASDAEVAQLRESLKKAVFLHSHLIQKAEKQAAAASDAALPAKARGGKAGKKAASAKTTFEWAEFREAAVARLLESLELDLAAIWGHGTPDEALLHLYSSAAEAVLEHPAALKAASQPLREALWRLIAIPAVKYGQDVSAATSIVSLVVTHDHLPVHLAELMRHLLEEHQAARLVAAVVRALLLPLPF